MDKAEIQRIFNKRSWELGRDERTWNEAGDEKRASVQDHRARELVALATRLDLNLDLIEKENERGLEGKAYYA